MLKGLELETLGKERWWYQRGISGRAVPIFLLLVSVFRLAPQFSEQIR